MYQNIENSVYKETQMQPVFMCLFSVIANQGLLYTANSDYF